MPDRNTEENRRVKITALGHHTHLGWFIHRLQAQGVQVEQTDVRAEQLYRIPEMAQWSGLIVDDILLDCNSKGLVSRRHLASLCHQQGRIYAEMAGHWLDYGIQHGFPLFIGAKPETVTRLQPLLDLLAPRRSVWLYCGPAGAGYYAARTLGALSQAAALAFQTCWSASTPAIRSVDWQAFMENQQQLLEKLDQLARLYLSEWKENEQPSPWEQLQAFSLPPRTQAHFAGNLARLIVLTLEQRQARHEIFQQLIRTGAQFSPPQPPET